MLILARNSAKDLTAAGLSQDRCWIDVYSADGQLFGSVCVIEIRPQANGAPPNIKLGFDGFSNAVNFVRRELEYRADQK